ncbi:CCA tRNA nucleotidyltransferase [Metabacillus malikii]|uniref:CCA-adding enzyme n=1 Tax=Metabacillus malikii TaxID=1504265 RepID=A0ABT9Z9T1_9BACI|nr:CCA tRNA nucleotidyltransferase [Metabacillus malikii]MDQ0228780.1 tRNA nucleotidyltransferase (CCA-adding enzyme) [Metabacillus malikii]
MDTPFAEAKPILQKLHLEGYEAYFVGGAVRDSLLEKEIGDVDIATSAEPHEVQRIFTHTVDVGAEHGTIIVLFNESQYEVTTFRTESEYEGFRKPKSVTYISSLKEDLKRRDFTINAMAMDINEKIYDYFDGKRDLENRLIRTVGEPSERFAEDALRMLRAVRFVSQLNFTVSSNTVEAIKDNVHLLKEISVERKTVEFIKILKNNHYQVAIKLLIDTNIHKYLPGLETCRQQLMSFSCLPLSVLNNEEIWALLLYKIKPASVESFLRLWKLPVKLIKHVSKMLIFIDYLSEQKKWTTELLYSAGIDIAVSVERIFAIVNDCYDEKRINKVVEQFSRLPIKSRRELVITGHDIIKLFHKRPGPWVSAALSSIEKEILSETLKNDREAIKEWLLTCNLNFEQNY